MKNIILPLLKLKIAYQLKGTKTMINTYLYMQKNYLYTIYYATNISNNYLEHVHRFLSRTHLDNIENLQ